jgi:4'-phosphopantetheinyl transferase
MFERGDQRVVDIRSFHEDGACPVDVARREISDGEPSKARSFRTQSDRDAFARGRATIREILAAYLDQQPNEIQVETSRYGKPSLTADSGLHLNWSHSSGRWLMTVTSAGLVGADIERVSPDLDWQGPADIAFHADERRFIIQQASGRVERFCRLWVRKEAAFKAADYGLHNAMARVTVVNPDGALATSVTVLGGTRWHLHDASVPGAAYSAAVAVGFPRTRLHLCDLADLPTHSRAEMGHRLPTALPNSVTWEARG